jgi:MFS family permease
MLSNETRTLYTIFSITLMGVIGVSILSPALPGIRNEFGITNAEVVMLISAFTFPGIFFAPVMGMLADRFGRRKILVPCLFLFAIAGVGCAFVDFRAMLLLRFLQGIGGSALIALSATLIGDIYEGIERAKALGYNASVISIGIVSFLPLGGILAHFSWRLPFFTFAVALPIGIAAAFIPSPEVRPQKIHVYFLNTISLLKNGKLLLEFASGMAVFIILYGAFLGYFPILLEDKYKLDPFLISLLLASMNGFAAVFSSRLGYFVKRFGSIKTIRFGYACYSLSMLIIPFIPLHLLILSTFILGIGHGMVMPAIQNLVLSTAPAKQRAMVMTTFGSVMKTGQTLGPVIASIAYLYSFNAVFLVMAGIAAIFFIVYIFFSVEQS